MFSGGALCVLAGCAPCQPFSRYARRSGERSPKWEMIDHFFRLATSIRPEVLTMENVPELQGDKAFAHFVDRLQASGYRVSYSKVFCPYYGIPQQRTRLVLFASLYGAVRLEAHTHNATNYKTVRKSIAHLAPLRAGSSDSDDPLHRASNLTPLNLQRIGQSTPGGSWRDWPTGLIAKCHLLRSGETYPSVYGRMKWDAPSPTITTQFFGFGNGRFGHPSQNRAISLREGAILQSFPEDYAFTPPGGSLSLLNLAE